MNLTDYGIWTRIWSLHSWPSPQITQVGPHWYREEGWEIGHITHQEIQIKYSQWKMGYKIDYYKNGNMQTSSIHRCLI